MSKGSNPRPIHVPRDQYNSNWDAVFGKKDTKEDKQTKNKQK